MTAQRNAALILRARAHGVELAPENEAACVAIETTAAEAEFRAEASALEIKRLREALAAAIERGKPLADVAKGAREKATMFRAATLSLSVRQAATARKEAEIASLERKLAAARAKLCA